jgi:hypothetical protein
MRIEEAPEPRRFKIIDAPNSHCLFARDQRKRHAGVRGMFAIIDARKEAADLIGIEQKTFVNGFAPAVSR